MPLGLLIVPPKAARFPYCPPDFFSSLVTSNFASGHHTILSASPSLARRNARSDKIIRIIIMIVGVGLPVLVARSPRPTREPVGPRSLWRDGATEHWGAVSTVDGMSPAFTANTLIRDSAQISLCISVCQTLCLFLCLSVTTGWSVPMLHRFSLNCICTSVATHGPNGQW